MKRVVESGRNMVASPHAKTSRRRSPRVALILLDKTADIFDKTCACCWTKIWRAQLVVVFVGIKNVN